MQTPAFESKPRLSFDGVKIKPRSINYFSDEGVALAIDAMPAQYKNINGDMHVVTKRGYVVMKWIEYNKETNELNYAAKREFVIQPQNIDMILGINPH